MLVHKSWSTSITVSSHDYLECGSLLITTAMDVMMEETFGPVVGIMKVESDEEALGLMNDSPYGLVCLFSA